MALYGMSITVACLLSDRFPEGYTLEELGEAAGDAHWFLKDQLEFMKRAILGYEDGHPHEYAEVRCWEFRSDGKIYFTPNAEVYSGFDEFGFRTEVRERYLKRYSKPRSGD